MATTAAANKRYDRAKTHFEHMFEDGVVPKTFKSEDEAAAGEALSGEYAEAARERYMTSGKKGKDIKGDEWLFAEQARSDVDKATKKAKESQELENQRLENSRSITEIIMAGTNPGYGPRGDTPERKEALELVRRGKGGNA